MLKEIVRINREGCEIPTHLPKNIIDMIEDKIYFCCYSRISKNTIPGFDQDDLAQELRNHIYRKLQNHVLNDYRNPKGWVVTCMKRKLIDLYRKQERSKDVFERCEIYSPLDKDDLHEEDI